MVETQLLRMASNPQSAATKRSVSDSSLIVADTP
jgi:hypothetical protein